MVVLMSVAPFAAEDRDYAGGYSMLLNPSIRVRRARPVEATMSNIIAQMVDIFHSPGACEAYARRVTAAVAESRQAISQEKTSLPISRASESARRLSDQSREITIMQNTCAVCVRNWQRMRGARARGRCRAAPEKSGIRVFMRNRRHRRSAECVARVTHRGVRTSACH